MKKRNEDKMAQRANAIYLVLKKEGDWVLSPIIEEKTSLTSGQVKSAVRWARRKSINEFDRYIEYYFLSGRKGYKLPSKEEALGDIIKCYKCLDGKQKSIETTIQPLRKLIVQEGYDPDKIFIESNTDNYEETTPDGCWYTDDATIIVQGECDYDEG